MLFKCVSKYQSSLDAETQRHRDAETQRHRETLSDKDTTNTQTQSQKYIVSQQNKL